MAPGAETACLPWRDHEEPRPHITVQAPSPLPDRGLDCVLVWRVVLRVVKASWREGSFLTGPHGTRAPGSPAPLTALPCPADLRTPAATRRQHSVRLGPACESGFLPWPCQTPGRRPFAVRQSEPQTCPGSMQTQGHMSGTGQRCGPGGRPGRKVREERTMPCSEPGNVHMPACQCPASRCCACLTQQPRETAGVPARPPSRTHRTRSPKVPDVRCRTRKKPGLWGSTGFGGDLL